MPVVPLPELRRMTQEPAGDWTITDVVDATGLEPDSLTVSIDGQVIERDEWATTSPEPGASVILSQKPGVVSAAYAIGTTVAGMVGATTVVSATIVALTVTALAFAAISFGLAALANAFAPTVDHDSDAIAAGSRRTISGSRNRLEEYSTLPQVLGKHRFFPPFAARSYTMVEGGKLIQYALFTFGFGKLALSELKIGDEPLFKDTTTLVYTGKMVADADAFSSDNNNTDLVELELRQGTSGDEAVSLFSADIQEDIISTQLTERRGWVRRTTLPNTTRITVILGAPNGLIWRSDSGAAERRTVRMKVRWRLVGALSWETLPVVKMTAKTLSSVYTKRTIDDDGDALTAGSYEVETRRVTEVAGDPGITDTTVWASMLSHREGTVTNPANLCLVAMRVQITNRFPALISTFNAVAQTDILNYDNGASWVQGPTSNPAAIIRHVLQGDANKRAVADATINLTKLQEFSADCITNGFEFNTVTQGRSTVVETLRQVAATGFASYALQDGLHSVVMSNDLSGAPTQHFGPRNLVDFHSERIYVTPPEALKVQFVDPDSGWLDTERICPDDSFTVASATTFERLDMRGITSSDQAYKLGRRHLAQLRLRPERYIGETDFEHLDCIRGDWVKWMSPTLLLGLATGRVISTTLNGGGDVLTATLDQECPMAAASYACRFRKSSNGATIYALVDTDAGNQTTITFTTPIDSASVPIAGDLFMFGEAGSESIDLVVQDIEPVGNLGARLTMVDAAPGILTASTQAIPAYDPQITIPPKIRPLALIKPRVLVIAPTDTREKDGRGPVIRRGLRVRLQPPGVTVRR